MQTLIVYEIVPEETKFFLVPGDRSELHGCFCNTVGVEKKFSKKIVAEVSEPAWGEELKLPFRLDADTKVVNCGFVL